MVHLVDVSEHRPGIHAAILQGLATVCSEKPVLQYISKTSLASEDIKGIFEVAAKDTLDEFVSTQIAENDARFGHLLDLLVKMVPHGICSPATICTVLSELFDQLPLSSCQHYFSMIEDRTALWRSEPYFESCKNILLRTCNDLLRRCSKSLNTFFCGRIQLFLSRLFPIDEKSALNLLGQFNVDNVTSYRTEPWETEPSATNGDVHHQDASNGIVDGTVEEMETDGPTTSVSLGDGGNKIMVDFELYVKFWSLQETFRKPNDCYVKEKWENFVSNAKTILQVFDSHPLEDDQSNSNAADSTGSQNSVEVFFTKYLTNEKLLDLQLSDSSFRRCILGLSIFLYDGLYTILPYISQNTLSLQQDTVVRDLTEKCYQLLRKTFPTGEVFARAVEKFLASEEGWNKWKNEGCPSFLRAPVPPVDNQKKKRRVGDEIEAVLNGSLGPSGRPAVLRLGTADLNRNFQPMASGDRDWLATAVSGPDAQPDLRECLKAPLARIAGTDTNTNRTDDVEKPEWQWRTLRLMVMSGPSFFMSDGGRQQPGSKKPHLALSIPDYLDTSLSHYATPQRTTQTSVQAQGTSSAAATPKADSIGNAPTPQDATVDESGTPSGDNIVTDQDQDVGALDAGGDDTEDKMAVDGGTGDSADGKSGAEPVVRDHLDTISLLLSAHWQTLARHLGVDEDDIAFYSQDEEDKSKQALKMITIWEETKSLDGPVPLSKLQAEMRKVPALEPIADRLSQLPGMN